MSHRRCRRLSSGSGSDGDDDDDLRRRRSKRFEKDREPRACVLERDERRGLRAVDVVESQRRLPGRRDRVVHSSHVTRRRSPLRQKEKIRPSSGLALDKKMPFCFFFRPRRCWWHYLYQVHRVTL